MRFITNRRGVELVGVGGHVPASVLTNGAFESTLDTTDAWIRTRTGISERRVLSDAETLWELCVPAARRALFMAGLAPGDLDLIVVATASPDYPMPSVATLVQAALHAPSAAAFDLQAACTGFVYGLVAAAQFLRSGMYNNALVIGADALSRFMDPKDRSTSILFGDGAGAIVLRASDQEGLHAELLAADGRGANQLMVREKLEEPEPPNRMRRRAYMSMNGREIYRFVLDTAPTQIRQACQRAGLELDQIDRFLFHQANGRLLQALAERLGIPARKVPLNLERLGNTSAASIPLLFAQEVENKRIVPGNRLCLTGFGAGLTWATAIATWQGPPYSHDASNPL